ncbi:MAG: hypothetical protein AABY95_03750 [Pseudomonadota bacterium]
MSTTDDSAGKLPKSNFLGGLAWESIRSGTIASLIMMPFGLLFRMLDLRIGHYGKKLIEVMFGELPLALFRTLVLSEHFIIGWLSTAPLLLLLIHFGQRLSIWIIGTLYGVAYYVAINSLFLPWCFDELTPWQLGIHAVYPSLIVHLVFGLSIVWTSRRFVEEIQRAK